jgi:DNA polymerase
MKIHVDFESRSPVDLRASGSYKYAMDPRTEILCMGVAVGDNPVKLLKPNDLAAPGIKGQFERAIARPDVEFVAHGVHFESPMWRYCMTRQFGYPDIPNERWNCTLARCVTLGLPASLEKAGLSLNLPVKKDLEGRSALLKICKPIGYDPLGDPIYNEDPALYEKVYKYCPIDVEVERLIDKAVPELVPSERAIFYLDLKINHRGIAVDLPLAQAAKDLAAELTGGLNARLAEITNGAVDKATRVANMKRYLATKGVEVDSLDKAGVTAVLERPDVSEHIKEVLSIRRQVGKSSTAKFEATLQAACADGRVRGALQYHAAHTGRDGGRLIQIQNYPKGFLPEEQAKAIQAIGFGAGAFAALYDGKSMQALSDILRGTIIAGPGKNLIAADFNAIEARVNFWLAGDQAALNTYRSGGSPYFDMGEFIFKRPITKKDAHEYAVAKMTILGAGFGMGAKRFLDQCAINGIEITEQLAETAIKSFREKYRAIVQTWYATEAAAISAVRTPGSIQPAMGGRVLFGMSKNYPDFLVAKLPSGRFLWYYKPSVHTVPWFDGEKQELRYWANVDAQNRGKCIQYDAEKELGQLKTYGGSLVENITQAVARDILKSAAAGCEKAGYPVAFCVHDEVVAENPVKGSLEEFSSIMTTLPGWALGLPVAVEGFIAARYRK